MKKPLNEFEKSIRNGDRVMNGLVGILLLFMVGFIVSCVKTPEEDAEKAAIVSEFSLKCFNIGKNSFMDRCENKEAVCYRYGEGLQCKFKDLK